MKIDAFHGFTLAILLLFVGKGLVARSGILRRYSIPESLVGGLACALVVFALYYGAGIVVSFDLEARDALLLYFFAAIGLGTDARTLRHGGRPLLILSGLATVVAMLRAGIEVFWAAPPSRPARISLVEFLPVALLLPPLNRIGND